MQKDIEKYYNIMVNEKLFSSVANLKFYLNEFFQNIDFQDKIVLDVGGGSGLLSFYAGVSGAKQVICIEPEAEGSSSGEGNQFAKIKVKLNLQNVNLEVLTFQAYKEKDQKFDIIILKDSINHLNELACIDLHRNPKSQQIYKDLFSNLYELANKQARVILSDCSRYNMFQLLGIKNIYAPSIEWQKHQSPKVWIKLLKDVGFIKPKLKLTSFSYLRSLGKILFGNKLLAYFFKSYFSITVQKDEKND